MEHEQEREQIEVVKSKRTGRELARLDHATGKLRVQDGPKRTWINVREMLDKRRDE